MWEVADVVRRDGGTYIRKFGKSILPSHRRALREMAQCRTAALGGHVFDCDRCGHRLYAYHSCKNRSCPKCQGKDSRGWLEKRREELLDVPYFHLVFTLPKELRPIVRQHQKTLYGVLMKAAAQALMKLSADPRYVGGQVGIMAVLHTWTATMQYHPHAHLLVPGGGVTPDREWVVARKNYLVPVHALSRIFRGLFMALAKRALPQQRFPESVWSKRWVVYCKPTVQGTDKVLHYLARYVHRVAFANSRLVHVSNGRVTFRYLDRRQPKWKTMTLASEEFLRRFLQHVLPRGTHKVRYYGFWNPMHRKLLRQLQLLIGEPSQPEVSPDQIETGDDANNRPSPTLCPHCHQGEMVLVKRIPRQSRGPP